MSVKDYAIPVKHILEHIQRMKRFVGEMSYEEFCKEDKAAYAVFSCFCVMGEAARRLPEEIRERFPEIPWAQMIRMRSVMIHEYDRIALKLVWSTIKSDIPTIEPHLERMHQILQQSDD